MSYCSRSRRRRFTVSDFKVEYIVAFTAIFSNICTAHAQKRLLMKFRCKFRHRRLIPTLRFPSRVQNFGVLATFQFIFAFHMLNVAIFLLPVCLTYWPKSIPHASTPMLIIPTKFEVDVIIHCRVKVFCLMTRYVTLWPWRLTFWHPTAVTHGGSRDQPCYQVWNHYAYAFLSFQL